MANEIKELRQKNSGLMDSMKAILDKADTEKRALTAEEVKEYDRIEDEFDKNREKTEEIERRNRQEKRELELAALKKNDELPPESKDLIKRNFIQVGEKRIALDANAEKRMDVFNRFLSGGVKELRENELREIASEQRALQADADIYGGYLIAPQQWVQSLIMAMDDEVFIQGLATVYQIPTAASLGAPSLDNDPADPDWTKEIGTGSEDSTLSFGKRELYPHPLAKRVKVSRKLIRQSTGVLSAENIVRGRLSYKFSVTAENAYQNGTGNEQPLGLFTALTGVGITTSRDVSTGNTTTTIGADGLIDAKYSLKAQYMARANWIFHRTAIKQIRKLKDGNGDYLWLKGLAGDRPDTILDRPYFMSEYCPHTFTTGLYVGIFGDFSFYWIAIALDMEIQRLEELYAETNQVGFIGRMEIDGMPVLEEAFARVKLA